MSSSSNHPQNHRLLTARDVADKLQISIRTVRRLIASGKIDVMRVGPLIRISPEALEAYLSEAASQ